jgi:hypothetical protein
MGRAATSLMGQQAMCSWGTITGGSLLPSVATGLVTTQLSAKLIRPL